MENIFALPLNALVALILLAGSMMLYVKLKELVYKVSYVGTKITFWGRVGLFVLWGSSLAVVLAAYVTGLEELREQVGQFMELELNRYLLGYMIYIYFATLGFALPFWVLLYLIGTSRKRKNRKKIHPLMVIKQKVEAFYEELDHAVFIYLARKNGIEKSSGSFRDYRYFSNMREDLSCKECLITLYYSLLLNRKYIGKLDDQIEDILNILGRNMPENDKEFASLFQKTLIVSGKIKKKLEEIAGFFKSHPDITAVGDDEMPHFYIEGQPDASMEILRMFEELSIVILDNKHLSDALLEEVSARIRKLER